MSGYCFGASEAGEADLFGCAAGEREWDDERTGSLQERFLGGWDDGEGDEAGRRGQPEERHMTEEDLREELLPPGHPARRGPRPVDLQDFVAEEKGEEGTLV